MRWVTIALRVPLACLSSIVRRVAARWDVVCGSYDNIKDGKEEKKKQERIFRKNIHQKSGQRGAPNFCRGDRISGRRSEMVVVTRSSCHRRD